MQTVQVDTELVPLGERLDVWRSALEQTFGPLQVDPLDGQHLAGRLKTSRREAFSFHSMLYRGMGLWRRPVDVAQLGDEYFTLTRPISGLLHVTQGRHERRLEPGRAYLFNHAVTYRTTPAAEYQTVSVAIPAEALRRRVRSLAPFYDLHAACGEGPGLHLITAYADSLAQGVQRFSDHEYTRLVDQFVDLIGLFLETPRAMGGCADSTTQAGHRERAARFIQANAADGELTPARVAAACGISLGYLHDVFRGARLSVEEKIFEERLLLARKLLIDPLRRGVPVGSLSYEAGFNDPAHFSRAFKKRFSVTPGEMRREAFCQRA
ncbi:MAG: helix-turn-helix domain-containing protein [Burkholderiales bacterium]|nr:helix-turn-helix domain-containing protein [Burkholderiales bacterium]